MAILMADDVKPLDHYVGMALDFIGEHGGFSLELPPSRRTLVVGSQNGYWTGRLVYRQAGRCFSDAEEVQAIEKIDRESGRLGDVAIVSATGSREVVDVARRARERSLPVSAITCNPRSELKAALGGNFNEIIVPAPAKPEPATINTVTYGMMIYGATREDPGRIADFIRGMPKPGRGYGEFGSFDLLLPDSMLEVARMAGWKMVEIFGRGRGALATNITNARHGGFVRHEPDELVIGIGIDDAQVERLRRGPIPKENMHLVQAPGDLGPLGYLMASYHIIGQIQRGAGDKGFASGLRTYR